MSVTIYLVPNADLPASLYSDAQFAALADAVTAWINSDLGPAWGQDWQGHYPVKAIPRGQPAPARGLRSWVFDCRHSSTVPGAAGWHSADANGFPFGEIAMGDILAIGMHPEGVVSHEVAETCVNRFVDGAVLAIHNGAVGAWQTEACDPCEQFGYAYSHNGQVWQMTDFVTPAYFHVQAPGPYSYRRNCPAPLTPAQNGRQAYWDSAGWHQVGAQRAAPLGVHLGAPLHGHVTMPSGALPAAQLAGGGRP